MELSVDQKIKEAIDPLLQRISALQTSNQHLKQELSALRGLIQPKVNNKPAPKTSFDHGQRPQTAKINRKEPQHHEVKPDSKGPLKIGNKKQEVKAQNEEAKTQGTKPVVTKATTTANKVIPSQTTQKDGLNANDLKLAKPKQITTIANKSNLGNNKGTVSEKKPQLQKKQQGEEEKKNLSQEKQQKTNSKNGSKTALANKGKQNEKTAEKKPIVAPSPAPGNKKPPTQPPQKQEPKALKGGKAKPAIEAEAKEQEKKQVLQGQIAVPDQGKVLVNQAQNSTEAKNEETSQSPQSKEQQKKEVNAEKEQGKIEEKQQVVVQEQSF